MIYTRWVKSNLDDLHSVFCRTGLEKPVDAVAERTDYIVAYEDDVPAAAGILSRRGDLFYIEQVAVVPEFRGRRYGDLVVRMLIRRAFDSGAKSVYVNTPVETRGFFEKLGFVEIENNTGSRDKVTMVRTSDVSGCCGGHHG